VLLVGGMTRVPLVRKLVQQFFSRGRRSVGINPDEAVALGAAVHAIELSFAGKQGQTVLIDVATHSLSVGVLGGTVRKLIGKNTAGAGGGQEPRFCPTAPARRPPALPVYQGESDWADECTRLGEVVLSELIGRAAAATCPSRSPSSCRTRAPCRCARSTPPPAWPRPFASTRAPR
jgi:molecular chaperone DnaK